MDGSQDAVARSGYGARRTALILASQDELGRDDVDLESRLTAVLQRLLEITGAEGAAVEVAADDDSVMMRAAVGSARQRIGLSERRDQSAPGLCLDNASTVWYGDGDAGGRIDVEIAAQRGMVSAVLVPLWWESQAQGVLEVIGSSRDAFDEWDVRTLQMMAALVGDAFAAASLESTGAAFADSHGVTGQQHALHDRLTGLPNRMLLFDRLAQGIQVARREDAPLSVLTVDIDEFGPLSERLGRSGGDSVLAEFAARLRDTLRASDTVARLRDDEFVILLPGANAIGAVGTAKKIQRAIGEAFTVEGRDVSVAGSIGIAIFPEHGDDATELLEHSGAALGQTKRGPAPYGVYGDG